MAELKSHNEQSMEEILAAIKHIMAEEGSLESDPPAAPPARSEAPARHEASTHHGASAHHETPTRHAAASATEAKHQPPAAPALAAPDAAVAAVAPTRLPPVQDAILDLTDRVDDDLVIAPRPVTPEPQPVAPATAAAAASRLNRPPPLKTAVPPADVGARRIISDATLSASVATLSQIATIAAAGRQSELPLGDSTRTLEEMVRELLHPHLKEWLDSHLPKLVERLVRDEISRLVREAQGQ